ncbi:MAG: hypothetical protein ACKO5K_04505 [Armatimonadota bacterium]
MKINRQTIGVALSLLWPAVAMGVAGCANGLRPVDSGIAGTYLETEAIYNPLDGRRFDAKYVFRDDSVDIFMRTSPDSSKDDWAVVLEDAKVETSPHAIQVDWKGCTPATPCGKSGIFNTNSEVFNIESDGKVLRGPTGHVLVKQF